MALLVVLWVLQWEVLVIFYQMLILHIPILVNHLYHCIANYHWSYILFVESSKDALKFKNQSLNSIEDDDADLFEMKSNLNFNKSSIIIYIQLIISFVALLLIVFGHGSNSDVLYAIIPYMLTIIPSIMLGFFNRRFDSRYPKIGEKIILKNLSTFG